VLKNKHRAVSQGNISSKLKGKDPIRIFGETIVGIVSFYFFHIAFHFLLLFFPKLSDFVDAHRVPLGSAGRRNQN